MLRALEAAGSLAIAAVVVFAALLNPPMPRPKPPVEDRPPVETAIEATPPAPTAAPPPASTAASDSARQAAVQRTERRLENLTQAVREQNASVKRINAKIDELIRTQGNNNAEQPAGR